MSSSSLVSAVKVFGLLSGVYALSYVLRVTAGLYLYFVSSSVRKTLLEQLVQRIFPGMAQAVAKDRAMLSKKIVEQTDSRLKEGYRKNKARPWAIFAGAISALCAFLYFLMATE